MKYITSNYSDFIESFEKSLYQNKNISIHGLELFKQKDVITGCQHFIDQMIMTHGLDNLQVFKGGYNYYQRLNANFRFVNLDTMEAGRPLILEYPFPKFGAEHPDFQKIIKKSNNLGIDIYLENNFRMVSFPNVMIGKYYLDTFPMDFLIEKYKDKYLNVCKDLDLVPTNNIINAYSKKKQSMVGIANAIIKNND